MRLAIAFIGIQTALAAAILGCGNHPSDQALMANFEAHGGDFEQMLGMVREDADAARIASDFVIPDGVISVERWNSYKELSERTRRRWNRQLGSIQYRIRCLSQRPFDRRVDEGLCIPIQPS